MEHMDDFNINYEYICRYIRRTIKPSPAPLDELERYAKQHDVPIAQPETMRFIEVLIKMSDAKRVLEVGAAIGYSAISLAMCGAEVVTIERSEDMLAQLNENVTRHGFSDKITVLPGDAAEVLRGMDERDFGQFDLIFLDAAKAQYMDFLPHCLRLLRPGGVLMSDNILYKGMVATDELATRRKITIIRRLRKYLEYICNHELLDTAIIPIGDGCALSWKKI